MSERAPISCPFLRAFILTGGGVYGRVSFHALRQYAARAGAPLKTRLAIPAIALIAGGARDLPRNLRTRSVDLAAIMGGPLDKGGRGSRSLRGPDPGAFNPEAFERAYVRAARPRRSADGTEQPGLTADDLRRLSAASRERHGGTWRTAAINLVEMMTLIDVFGEADAETGERYVPLATVRALFEHARLPD